MQALTPDQKKQIEQMYTEGCSDSEVAAALGVTVKQFNSLYEKSKDFATVIDAGRTVAQAWWEKTVRTGLFNKNLNVQLLTFAMKNKWGWADKSEVKQSEEPMTDKAIDDRITALKAKLYGEEGVPLSSKIIETN
jgi:hypothetical protein